jgi:hypothetical protein
MVKYVRPYEMLEMQVNWLKKFECQIEFQLIPFVWVHKAKERVEIFQIVMYHIKKFILHVF